jgi:dTDP-4-dehydrorhamnose reductase
MEKTALIVGAGGQLGVELAAEFGRRGWSVTARDRSSLDITQGDAVAAAVAQANAALVINSAAFNQVDLAEREPAAAFAVNALAVRHLAVACRHAGARLVHLSTDYVFDGRKGSPYIETDETHPLSAYGVSKLAGELYARAYCEDALIIRTAAVFGSAGRFTSRGNFVELMLRLAAKGPVRVVSDQATTPTYAPALARFTADLVDACASGVFHGGGPKSISWFDYAALIFAAAGVRPELHRTTAAEFQAAAQRPPLSALDNSRARALGLTPFPALEESLEEYFAARETNASARA